jgi:hypothetical protein
MMGQWRAVAMQLQQEAAVNYKEMLGKMGRGNEKMEDDQERMT